MKISRSLQAGVLATASLLTFSTLTPTSAGTFDTSEVNTDNFIAVAAPFGENKHQLLIIEQVSNRRPCWSESGSNPVSVDPLLLNFDFTGICSRSTDSNGYSIRMSDQDLGLDYILRIVERNGDLVLVGSSTRNRNAPPLEIGRTGGTGSGFKKIILNPGWRFTRRSYQGRALGHIYLTTNSTAPATPAVSTSPRTQPEAPLREFTFTKPETGTPAPANSQTLPPLPAPASRAPGYIVPTTPPLEQSIPEPQAPAPVTSPQTLPPPPAPPASNSNRGIPVFAVPTK